MEWYGLKLIWDRPIEFLKQLEVGMNHEQIAEGKRLAEVYLKIIRCAQNPVSK